MTSEPTVWELAVGIFIYWVAERPNRFKRNGFHFRYWCARCNGLGAQVGLALVFLYGVLELFAAASLAFCITFIMSAQAWRALGETGFFGALTLGKKSPGSKGSLFLPPAALPIMVQTMPKRKSSILRWAFKRSINAPSVRYVSRPNSCPLRPRSTRAIAHSSSRVSGLEGPGGLLSHPPHCSFPL
jgi:hypothetical protein